MYVNYLESSEDSTDFSFQVDPKVRSHMSDISFEMTLIGSFAETLVSLSWGR